MSERHSKELCEIFFEQHEDKVDIKFENLAKLDIEAIKIFEKDFGPEETITTFLKKIDVITSEPIKELTEDKVGNHLASLIMDLLDIRRYLGMPKL